MSDDRLLKVYVIALVSANVIMFAAGWSWWQTVGDGNIWHAITISSFFAIGGSWLVVLMTILLVAAYEIGKRP